VGRLDTSRLRRRAPLPVVMLSLALVGCGSTVQTAGTSAGDSLSVAGGEAVSGDGLSLDVETGTPGEEPVQGAGADPVAAGADGTSPGQSAPAGSGGTAGAPAAAAAAGGGTAPAARPGAAATGADGPGVTKDKITFVYQFYTQSAEADRVVGVTFDYGDPLANLKAVVKHVNSTGGVAGRTLDLQIYNNESGPNSGSFAAQAQATCDRFTQDAKTLVFAPVDHEVLRECLHKRGVLGLGVTRAELGEPDFERVGSYLDTLATTPAAASRALLDALDRTRYFSESWNAANGSPGGVAPVKVGILHSDAAPWQRAVQSVLLPELRRRGVATETFEYRRNSDAADFGSTVASIQSAVLRFRGSGVTHVIPTDAAALGFFGINAEGQGYRPRYGLQSNTTAQALVDGAGLPREQLRGALGVGWLPAVDLKETGGRYDGPGKAACLAILKAQGISNPPGSLAEASGLAACDLVLLVKASIEAIPAGRPVTAGNAALGAESLGGRFPWAALPAGGYGPGKRYPITTAYGWAWDTGCGCATYTTAGSPVR
jgi:hypothetical protein